MSDPKRPVFIDACVVFDYIAIKRLDLLVRLFGKIHVVRRVDEQVKRDRKSYDVWRDDFPVYFPEAAAESELADLRKKYGVGVGDADRSAAIAARDSGGILLTRDELLIEEAVRVLRMSPSDFIGTVEILEICVKRKFLKKKEALTFCDDISEKRCRREPLDRSRLEKLP